MRILIIRFSSIGDIVLTTPVIRCLQEQLGARVDLLTKTAFAGVLAHNPYLHTIHRWEDMNLSDPNCPIRQAKYDWVIDLHNNLRSIRVRVALRRPSKSFDKLNWQKWLLVRVGWNLLPKRHIVDRYMDTVAHLGVRYDNEGLDYHFGVGTVEQTVLRIKSLIGDQSFVAFVIGAAHGTKRMPLESIAEVCRHLNIPVLLLGGKDETADGDSISQRVSDNNQVINLCGQLSLEQSAAVVQLAQKVITHDTGMMHIAAALNKQILSIWGNTIPAFGMTPFYENNADRNTTIEVSDLHCRPCSKIGFETCPKGHFKCMRDLDLQRIAEIANTKDPSTS